MSLSVPLHIIIDDKRYLRMEEPIRVLNVLGTTNLGGAESRVMELYRALDRDRVQFDFMVHTDKE